MINHDYKFIFLHIPKNAGNSIDSALSNYGSSRRGGPRIHYDEIDPRMAKDYFIFAVHRNPYGRMVSLWKYWLTIWVPRFANDETKKELNKYEWDFLNFCTNFDKFASIVLREYPLERVHFLPQVCINGNPTYVNVDFWMRFEHLQDDFNVASEKVGIPPQQLLHLNKASHKPYTKYYTSEIKQIVSEKCRNDIKYFGYEFGGLSSP